jgi:hypothetical protein
MNFEIDNDVLAIAVKDAVSRAIGTTLGSYAVHQALVEGVTKAVTDSDLLAKIQAAMSTEIASCGELFISSATEVCKPAIRMAISETVMRSLAELTVSASKGSGYVSTEERQKSVASLMAGWVVPRGVIDG